MLEIQIEFLKIKYQLKIIVQQNVYFILKSQMHFMHLFIRIYYSYSYYFSFLHFYYHLIYFSTRVIDFKINNNSTILCYYIL
jgi:hypothetical protein